MKKNIKMSDIAQVLNVSNVTVSKALADKDGVSEELRAKIKQLASEMGYSYNSTAKSLKDGRTYNIGIVVPERFLGQTMSFYWVLYQNISKELLKKNYYGIFEILKFEDEENLILPKMVLDQKIDGIIILGQANRKYVKAIMETDLAMICMDFYENIPNIDTIVTDNFYGTYLLTDYLIENGHRNIGFVGNIKATSSIQDRYLGYFKALIENDIAYNSQWTISDRLDSGANIDITLPDKMPTAFVCNCDETAYRLIKTLQKSGFDVPNDISVVGFDNYLISEICDPPITTVEVDMKAMAQAGVELIVQKINHVHYKVGRRLISGKIIIKNSVKNILS
jgi:LacI family transcriptional regulator